MFYFASHPERYALPLWLIQAEEESVENGDQQELAEAAHRRRHFGHRAGSQPRQNPRAGLGAVERRRLLRAASRVYPPTPQQETVAEEKSTPNVTTKTEVQKSKSQRKRHKKKAKGLQTLPNINATLEETEPTSEENRVLSTTLTKAQKKNLSKARARKAKKLRRAKEALEAASPECSNIREDLETVRALNQAADLLEAWAATPSDKKVNNETAEEASEVVEASIDAYIPKSDQPTAQATEKNVTLVVAESPSNLAAIAVVASESPSKSVSTPINPAPASPLPQPSPGLTECSPSPCRTFTADLGMEELTMILQKQERRMETQKRSTPAKIAAMNRERRFLQAYSMQSEAGLKMNQASIGMVAAVGQLHERLTPMRSGQPRSTNPDASVVQSWIRWARTAKNYGLQVWQGRVSASREASAPWFQMVEAVRKVWLKKDLQKISKAVQVQKRLRDDDAVSRAAAVKRESRLARLVKVCTLHEESSAGKVMLKEAAQHWQTNQIMCGLIAWMTHSQDSLVSTCLHYSAKTHWQHTRCRIAYQLWRSKLSTKNMTVKLPAYQNIKELQMKAHRLSLQSERCVQKVQRRRISLAIASGYISTPKREVNGGDSLRASPAAIVA